MLSVDKGAFRFKTRKSEDSAKKFLGSFFSAFFLFLCSGAKLESELYGLLMYDLTVGA